MVAATMVAEKKEGPQRPSKSFRLGCSVLHSAQMMIAATNAVMHSASNTSSISARNMVSSPYAALRITKPDMSRFAFRPFGVKPTMTPRGSR